MTPAKTNPTTSEIPKREHSLPSSAGRTRNKTPMIVGMTSNCETVCEFSARCSAITVILTHGRVRPRICACHPEAADASASGRIQRQAGIRPILSAVKPETRQAGTPVGGGLNVKTLARHTRMMLIPRGHRAGPSLPAFRNSANSQESNLVFQPSQTCPENGGSESKGQLRPHENAAEPCRRYCRGAHLGRLGTICNMIHRLRSV